MIGQAIQLLAQFQRLLVENNVVVFDGGIALPVEIGSSFVHATQSQTEEQRFRDQVINDVLPMLGIMPISEIDSYVEYDRPEDFEDAKLLVAEMFINA